MKSGAPPRIHPCICGFMCETYKHMRQHREACVTWQNRPNPMQLMIERRRATHLDEHGEEPPKFEPCQLCHRRPDHHDSSCPNSQAEMVRRALIKKHGIDPFEFEVFLRLLAKRYPPFH